MSGQLAVVSSLQQHQESGQLAVANSLQQQPQGKKTAHLRSKDARKRRRKNRPSKSKKRPKREQSITTFLPRTEGDFRAARFQDTFIVRPDHSVHFRFPDSYTIFRV